MTTFDWGSAGLGFVVGFCLAVVFGCFYFGLRSLRSRSSAGGYATFEDEEHREDDESFSAQERATQEAVTASIVVPGAVFGPPVEFAPVVQFGKVGEPHVYRAKEWDRPMACVGQTCNQAPFVDGQQFYEIPVADDDTALLVCVDCAADPE